MCTGMGEIGQVCIWELAGLVKLSAGAGQIGQEFMQDWAELVKCVCWSEWDWSRVYAGVGGIG